MNTSDRAGEIRRRRRLDVVLLVLAALVVGALIFSVALASGSERVVRVWAAAAVAGDGSARITEVIDWDFGPRARHGPQPPQGHGTTRTTDDGSTTPRGDDGSPSSTVKDTLVIELEDVGAPSWAPDVLVPVLSHANPHSWFVGHAASVDPRWPTYRITSTPFPRVHAVFDDVLPREAWPPGMAEALDELRRQLESEGWLPAGHGGRDWTYRYVRPRVAWPSVAEEASGRSLPVPPMNPARG